MTHHLHADEVSYDILCLVFEMEMTQSTTAGMGILAQTTQDKDVGKQNEDKTGADRLHR